MVKQGRELSTEGPLTRQQGSVRNGSRGAEGIAVEGPSELILEENMREPDGQEGEIQALPPRSLPVMHCSQCYPEFSFRSASNGTSLGKPFLLQMRLHTLM